MKFNESNVTIETKKDGVTGNFMHDVVIIQESGLKVSHSTFTTIEEAVEFRKELIAPKMNEKHVAVAKEILSLERQLHKTVVSEHKDKIYNQITGIETALELLQELDDVLAVLAELRATK